MNDWFLVMGVVLGVKSSFDREAKTSHFTHTDLCVATGGCQQFNPNLAASNQSTPSLALALTFWGPVFAPLFLHAALVARLVSRV